MLRKSTLDDLLRALSTQSQAERISRLVTSAATEALDDPGCITARWHPLGFLWVQLTDKDAQESLRLHLWSEDAEQDTEFLIHDHTFSFTSCVLCGGIKNDEYTATEDMAGAHQLFRVEYDGARSILRPTGIRITPCLFSSAIHGQGEFYSLPATTYHATTLPYRQFSATVVRSVREGERPAHVIGPAAFDSVRLCQRIPAETEAVVGILNRLLQELS